MQSGTQSIMELPIDVMLNTDSPDSAESDKSIFNLNGTPSLVFHKASVNTPHFLSDCIHSLRIYGYSYFTECNNIKLVDKYHSKLYFINEENKILLKFSELSLYKNSIIDSILRALSKADNLTHLEFNL